jgi:hypothetical protein
MIPDIFIKRVKPSINKMKAADLKALGFKTKAIATRNPNEFTYFVGTEIVCFVN